MHQQVMGGKTCSGSSDPSESLLLNWQTVSVRFGDLKPSSLRPLNSLEEVRSEPLSESNIQHSVEVQQVLLAVVCL